ncbi:MAG TPA: superoxide dismutase [Cu-Zn] SodC [Gammaproteobacteria bacterium]
MKTRFKIALFISTVFVCFVGFAETVVQMHSVNKSGVGKSIGEVTISESEHGLVFTPSLKGLPAGLHGFHVHENPSCQPGKKNGKVTPAGAAGGHYDPAGSKKHGTPWDEGHLGDLPALYVKSDGRASHPVLAPRLEMADLQGRALMIHEGSDNYSDDPKPLGGGGGRIACGIVKAE